MSSPCTVILSDLHLSAATAAFHQGPSLAAFLGRLAQEGPCELVLAGDVFDFLLTPGYTGFAPAQAPQHLQTLLAAHPAVVEALRRFAGQPGHEVTLLSGNHDPELLLPAVRQVFELAIGRPGSVRYDQVLLPGPGERWAVYGRALPGSIWVVHGDRWDPSNAIDRAAILAGSSPPLPAGSDLVYQVLAPLQPHHPWIYELKPELHAVLPLLLYLDHQRTMEYLRSHYQLTGRLLRNQVEGKLHASTRLFGPGEAPPPPPEDAPPEALVAALAATLGQVPAPQQAILLVGLEEWVRRGPPPSGTLASHGGVGRWLLRAWIYLLGQGQGRRLLALDGDDPLVAPAAQYAQGHASVVIAGHTHGPRVLPQDDLLYLNTGTWIPVGDIPEGPLESVIDQLEQGAPWPSQTPRTFARVEGSSFWLGACDQDGTPRRLP